jgi:protein required for attachment to host cells
MNKVNKILGQMETTVTPLAVPQDISSKGLQKQNQTWKTEISLFLDQQTEKLTQASKPFILTTPETSASTTVYDRTANNQPCNTPSSSGGYSPETTTPPKASAYMPNTPPSSKVSRKLNFEPKKNLATEIQKKHKAARKIRHMFRKPIKEKHNRRSPEEAAKKQSEEQDKQTQKSSEEAEKKQPEERRNVIHYLLATIIVIAGFQWMTNFIPRGLGYLRGKLYKKSGQQITSTPVAKLIPATQISIKQPTLEPKPGKNAASSHIKPKGLISPRNGIVINNK